MYIEVSKLGSVVTFWVLAALFTALGWGVKSVPDWVVILLRLLAMIFIVIAFITTLDWSAHHISARLKDLNYARTSHAIQLATALKGLTIKQTEMVARHDILEISGLIGDEGVIAWTVRAPGGDIPLEFIQDYLEMSLETQPYLWPVREHMEIKRRYEWRNAEGLAKATTDLFIYTLGWAEKSAGPYPAKLNRSMDWVLPRFGMDEDYHSL